MSATQIVQNAPPWVKHIILVSQPLHGDGKGVASDMRYNSQPCRLLSAQNASELVVIWREALDNE